MNQTRFKKAFVNSKGWGLVEILLLIVVIGVLLLILLKGITTSVVVVKDIDSNEQAMKLSTNYLNTVFENSKSREFYENIVNGDVPPIPLTSEYTNSGKYTVYVETESETETSKKVSVTYQKSSSTSFEDAIITVSTIIEAP